MTERGYERGSLALVNGRVFTASPDQPHASAVGIWNGLIAYVGNDAAQARAAAGAGAETIDLDGRTATPGLIDAHCHPIMYAEVLRNIDLGTVESVDEILERIRERTRTTPVGEPIAGDRYYALNYIEHRLPTRSELDAVAPDHPVVLTHRSGHEVMVNSATLDRIGYTRDTEDPQGGYLDRDEQGELTGILAENAMEPLWALRRPSGIDEYAELLRLTTDAFLSYGITSTTDANVADPNLVRAYQDVQSDSSRPRMRYNLMFAHWQMLDPALDLGLMTGLGNCWLRAGAMKFFLDGTEGQHTAKLSEPFADDPGNTGMWMFPPEEFRERVTRAHVAGWQCAVHAIGDAAVELTLDAYREAQSQSPRPDIRHRIEHASLLRPDLIDRFAREGIIPVPGARFASNDYPILLERFGAERLRWYQPWNSLIEHNIPVVVSSDAPVQLPDPAKNLWAIVNSRVEHDRDVVMQPEERIDLEEALVAYTRNGAWASHEERVKGMLRPGMVGDVTVFNTDVFNLDVLELDGARADMTVVDGVVAFNRSG